MNRRSWAGAAVRVLLAGMLVTLGSCGGGVGSGGTGMEASIAQGTVSGFGSVIVDGQRIDDSRVAAQREVAPGVEVLSDVRLGDSVEAELDRAGVAVALHVAPTLLGPVDSLVAPAGLLVLGQQVQVNADPAAGPVTQFGGGTTGLADLMPGDLVEIHGIVEAQPAAVQVRATRIEKRVDAPDYLKVSGLVAALDATKFSLGALTVHTSQALVQPPGRVLAEGQLVAVLAPASGRSGSASRPELVAAQVRVRTLGDPGEQVSVSGNVADLDGAMSTFRFGALTVRYAGARRSPSSLVLAAGQYLRVSGTLQADGSLQADRLTLRDGRNEPEAELKGNIIGLDMATQRFEVRGVTVDAAAARVSDCPGGVLAEGLYVEVEGDLSATGLVARSVQCESESTGGTVGRKGIAGSVDSAAQTFVLTRGDGSTVAVRWTENTFFGDVTPATLDGRRVEVEGVFVGNVMVAKKVKGED